MNNSEKIALVAHDNKKQDLLEWAKYNKILLRRHELYATGTSGKLLEQELGTEIHKLQSGPLGGDQQIGAKIAAGEIDLLIFFWDPLTTQPFSETYPLRTKPKQCSVPASPRAVSLSVAR